MGFLKNTIVFFCLGFIFALHPSLNKGHTPITYIQYLVYGNTLQLSYDNFVNKNNIKIKWECENNEANCKELLIYNRGKKVNDIPFEKGKQQLVVYYSNVKVGILYQNKRYGKQAHKYIVSLNSDLNHVLMKGIIEGPSPTNYSNSTAMEEMLLADLGSSSKIEN